MLSVQKDQTYGNVNFPKIILEKQIKGILLDLDNTLYSYDNCHAHAIDNIKVYLKNNYNISSEKFEKLYKQSRQRVNIDLNTQGSSHSRLLYFQKLTEDIFDKTKFDLILILKEIYWEAFFKEMILLENVLDFFKECKNNKLKICIVTDLTVEIQLKKLKKLNIEEYIDFLVTSEEAGVEKPHPYIFKLALEKLKLNENEVIMIGDNDKKDILGAENLSIQSINILKKGEKC
jgi:putative hydrolase of the HAD superfamily